MEQDYFKNLPSHITIDILSRLPIRTIYACKCVCKSWLDSLNSPEFVHLHLSKSLPGLAIYQDYNHKNGRLHKIYEFKDELDLPHHSLHYNPVTTFKFPHDGFIQGSTNGLLLLWDRWSSKQEGLYVCNPITRDYITLERPEDFEYSNNRVVTFGFGTSKSTGQLKVVRVSHDCVYDELRFISSISKSECHVYTLGSGSWRSVKLGASLDYVDYRDFGAFLHGNLHWFMWFLKGIPLISCFDLETQLFSTINPPELPDEPESLWDYYRECVDVFAFNDCLCWCDNSSNEKIVVWVMKEYGDEKSWSKEYVISKVPGYQGKCDEIIRPIKVFKDGDILMAWQWQDYWKDSFLFYCSIENSDMSKSIFYCSIENPSRLSITNIDIFETGFGSIYSIHHTSSFLSLKTFDREVVRSF